MGTRYRSRADGESRVEINVRSSVRWLPMTGEMFLAFMEQCPVPTLKRNEIVVMDNSQAHKVAGVREAN